MFERKQGFTWAKLRLGKSKKAAATRTDTKRLREKFLFTPRYVFLISKTKEELLTELNCLAT